jgi:hypothetical protein
MSPKSPRKMSWEENPMVRSSVQNLPLWLHLSFEGWEETAPLTWTKEGETVPGVDWWAVQE